MIKGKNLYLDGLMHTKGEINAKGKFPISRQTQRFRPELESSKAFLSLLAAAGEIPSLNICFALVSPAQRRFLLFSPNPHNEIAFLCLINNAPNGMRKSLHVSRSFLIARCWLAVNSSNSTPARSTPERDSKRLSRSGSVIPP